MKVVEKIKIDNEESLSKFAARMSSLFKPGEKISLEGPLGAGKTTFVRKLMKAWNYNEPVVSPSSNFAFTLPKTVGKARCQ